MKLYLFLLVVAFAIARPLSQYPNGAATAGLNPGVGWAFSGAGGRVGQQAALAEALLNGNHPGGQKVVPSYLSGVSSGSLSMIACNGVLEYAASKGASGWSQNSWNNFVFTLSDSKIYKTGVTGAITDISNLDKGYILDNSVLSTTLSSALQQMNYTNFGDLFLPSYITVVDQVSGENVRLLSTDPSVKNIPLIQILLASTAIPVAFPPRGIPGLTNSTVFIDGGTGIDYLPVIPLIDGSLPVTTLYGFVPNQDTANATNGDNHSLEDNNIIRNALRAYEIQGKNLFTGALSILANSNVTGYLYSAVLGQTFSTLNFNNEVIQYDLAKNWAASNKPISITTFSLTQYNSLLPTAYFNNNSTFVSHDDNLLGNGAAANGVAAIMILVCVAVATLS